MKEAATLCRSCGFLTSAHVRHPHVWNGGHPSTPPVLSKTQTNANCPCSREWRSHSRWNSNSCTRPPSVIHTYCRSETSLSCSSLGGNASSIEKAGTSCPGCTRSLRPAKARLVHGQPSPIDRTWPTVLSRPSVVLVKISAGSACNQTARYRGLPRKRNTVALPQIAWS